MKTRAEAEKILRDIAVNDDSDIDVVEGALALAALDRPGIELGRYRDHVARVTDDVGAELSRQGGLVGALYAVIHGLHGYTGDTLSYDDVQNANLMRVIDRKKGLPVALGILYLKAARTLGYTADGLNFPGHFMVRLNEAGGRHIVDPFNGGIERSAADLREILKATVGLDAELNPKFYEPVGNRDILIRLQNNIKGRHEQAGRIPEALRVLDGMLVFAPDVIMLWREVGILNARLGNLDSAISAFQTIIERAPSENTRHYAATIIRKLKSRLS
ncbi:MAG: transglutaminase-like domain-containing protein [Pseudomonadota bacterium]|nr:transglutaminase-like domain-containing protein [Pseudomonadota bacterium]